LHHWCTGYSDSIPSRPIALTCTLCVWQVADALVDYLLAQPGNESVRSINPVVGETNDGFLNDIRARHVKSSDVVKAIALGADAVYIGSAALVAMGCHLCQKCYTGKCPWGIATTAPWISKRVNPDIATNRLVNLLQAWSWEIKEMMGGMGVNSIESLRGNRLHLRGVGLTDTELRILGVKMAGD